jgi:hypothetical protein
MSEMKLFFSNVFNVSEKSLDRYGAFNISLITDLPLFIDPFLLFASEKPEYQRLHEQIIEYLTFLKKKSEDGSIDPLLIKAWYHFPEIKENWLGFCGTSNTGHGLGADFANALNNNLSRIFKGFGNEKITRGSHLEKLCLIKSRVGRDMISDFTTNLIKGYLLEYTEGFASKYINKKLCRKISIERVIFNYKIEKWVSKSFLLPIYSQQFVMLTPKDILTKNDTWISHNDLLNRLEDIPNAIENQQLRAQINNYLLKKIPEYEKLKRKEHVKALSEILDKYPILIDYYIREKEITGDEAINNSENIVNESNQLYVNQFGGLAFLLKKHTKFYSIPENTLEESRQKIEFLKDIVENKGGYKLLFANGKPIRDEKDIHIMFRLVWHNTTSDVSREANDGRGPADFKISRGASDKTIIEFKLASNSKLRKNILNQVAIYKKGSDAQSGLKVIFYMTEKEFDKVQAILKELEMQNDKNIYLIDARSDNKPSASNA